MGFSYKNKYIFNNKKKLSCDKKNKRNDKIILPCSIIIFENEYNFENKILLNITVTSIIYNRLIQKYSENCTST